MVPVDQMWMTYRCDNLLRVRVLWSPNWYQMQVLVTNSVIIALAKESDKKPSKTLLVGITSNIIVVNLTKSIFIFCLHHQFCYLSLVIPLQLIVIHLEMALFLPHQTHSLKVHHLKSVVKCYCFCYCYHYLMVDYIFAFVDIAVATLVGEQGIISRRWKN